MNESDKKYLISKTALKNITKGLSTDKFDERFEVFWAAIEGNLVEGTEKK